MSLDGCLNCCLLVGDGCRLIFISGCLDGVSMRVSLDVCRLMVVSWWVFVVGEMSLDGCLGLSR